MGLDYHAYLSKSESNWMYLFNLYIKNSVDTIVFAGIFVALSIG